MLEQVSLSKNCFAEFIPIDRYIVWEKVQQKQEMRFDVSTDRYIEYALICCSLMSKSAQIMLHKFLFMFFLTTKTHAA